ncbi:hypothetical protein SCHPADRAFT_929660 [Schizopora paradoxa]|uniref:Uncharacterized protein n=1 Tax=Schizopora paradoxa TaxID=27342 RepID=A0A0H2RJE4_9AGAM|nr:hypothetical protein SCHPADRAFT_929660 [Schizopora paradoxa]
MALDASTPQPLAFSPSLAILCCYFGGTFFIISGLAIHSFEVEGETTKAKGADQETEVAEKVGSTQADEGVVTVAVQEGGVQTTLPNVTTALNTPETQPEAANHEVTTANDAPKTPPAPVKTRTFGTVIDIRDTETTASASASATASSRPVLTSNLSFSFVPSSAPWNQLSPRNSSFGSHSTPSSPLSDFHPRNPLKANLSGQATEIDSVCEGMSEHEFPQEVWSRYGPNKENQDPSFTGTLFTGHLAETGLPGLVPEEVKGDSEGEDGEERGYETSDSAEVS